ncbi:SMI1/KNR4 family protein [Eubacterium sp.]|uniref:SMI1/KNR4 family protein n=1 Tax=Eubacterium sp. TaxID=142586 RepID=UPI0025D86939|nr:SMI1/KNR4 family protein [Eubacterium sp.]MCR5629089.1 SMI1/KNR4 family protein [Eubacterium sp.]
MSFNEVLNKKEDVICGKGVSSNFVEDAEKKLNLKFSNDYKEYLLTYGLLMFDGHEITGLGGDDRLDVVKVTLHLKELYSDIPKDWYVIEELGIDGVVIWQNEKGEIFQSIPNGKMVKIYDDLITFLRE